MIFPALAICHRSDRATTSRISTARLTPLRITRSVSGRLAQAGRPERLLVADHIQLDTAGSKCGPRAYRPAQADAVSRTPSDTRPLYRFRCNRSSAAHRLDPSRSLRGTFGSCGSVSFATRVDCPRFAPRMRLIPHALRAGNDSLSGWAHFAVRTTGKPVDRWMARMIPNRGAHRSGRSRLLGSRIGVWTPLWFFWYL